MRAIHGSVARKPLEEFDFDRARSLKLGTITTWAPSTLSPAGRLSEKVACTKHHGNPGSSRDWNRWHRCPAMPWGAPAGAAHMAWRRRAVGNDPPGLVRDEEVAAGEHGLSESAYL